jgi:hypothetical protein
MKKWRFYIDNVEVNEPNNWAEVGSRAERSIKRWGLFREVVPDTLQWGQVILPKLNGFDVLKNKWDNDGVNATAVLRIDKYNDDNGSYITYQNFEFDFSTYKEVFKFAKKAVIEIGLISSDIYRRMEQRWSQNFKVGNNKDFQGNPITTVSAQDVVFRSLPIVQEALLSVGDFNPLATNRWLIGSTGERGIIIPLRIERNNIDFLRESFVKTVSTIDLGNSGANYDQLLTTNTFVLRSEDTINDFKISYDLDINFWGQSALGDSGALQVRLYSAAFDGVNFTNPILEDTEGLPGLFFSNGDWVEYNRTFTKTISVTKAQNRVYFLIIMCAPGLSNPAFISFYNPDLTSDRGGITGTAGVNFFSIKADTTHKAYRLRDCFLSLMRQITGFDDILDSTLLSSGVYNDTFVTNGQLLRNAETIDGIEPDLELNMEQLWKWLSAQFPVGMDIRNDKLYIGLRPTLFGLNPIQIQPKEFTVRIADEMMYNSVDVGNIRVQYEDVNGTEEFNTKLNFTNNLLCRDNALDLVNAYNTDYLGVELARRLSFATAEKVDTKYDDKVFFVNTVASPLRTRRFTDGAGSDFSNYVFPEYVYNLPYTPKRALLRNSDLIAASMWKTGGTLRFEQIENQANLISRTNYLAESTPIPERADIPFAQMAVPIFNPIYIDCVLGEKDLEKVILNRNNIFIFVANGVIYAGYFWQGEINKDSGNITLLEARPPVGGLQLELEARLSNGN